MPLLSLPLTKYLTIGLEHGFSKLAILRETRGRLAFEHSCRNLFYSIEQIFASKYSSTHFSFWLKTVKLFSTTEWLHYVSRHQLDSSTFCHRQDLRKQSCDLLILKQSFTDILQYRYTSLYNNIVCKNHQAQNFQILMIQ